MDDFFRHMRDRLRNISNEARSTSRYCEQDEAEGCVLYEHLLNLETEIQDAVRMYAEEVPACSREDITRMVAADHAKTVATNV